MKKLVMNFYHLLQQASKRWLMFLAYQFYLQAWLKIVTFYSAEILAQVIDNDNDGIPDDRLVLDNIVGRGGYIIVSDSLEDSEATLRQYGEIRGIQMVS